MGAWGPGLYSSDFGCDLRSTVAAVARLPIEGDQILDILCETAPQAAADPENEEYTTFWLVTADQFQRRNVTCDRAKEAAISIIDSGADIAMMQQLGMSERDMRKRAAKQSELRRRLSSIATPKCRQMLSKPQSYVMEVGDVLTYPICRGQEINPYAADSKKLLGWVQDGWAAMLVAGRGRAFGYLAWYSIMVIREELVEKPSLQVLMDMPWTLRAAGTCSAVHFRRMELELAGKVRLDQGAITTALGRLPDGTGAAIRDISIANVMDVVSKNPSQPFVQPNLERLPTVTLRNVADPSG